MAQTDRVLVEIVTAANMTGIKQAQAGFLGMSNQLSALIVGIGLVAIATKSIIGITEDHEKAENDLAQAVKEHGGNLKEANQFLATFTDTNRSYFSSQSEVIDGYAALIRSGVPAAEAQKDMNRALDIAALKGISVTDATDLMIAAEHGHTRGLIDLGITTTKYTDAQGNVINQGKNMALVMAEIDAKTAHGRDTLTQTAQASNRLSNDWQDIANIAGPPLLNLFDGVLQAADQILRKLKELGENKDWNKFLADALGHIENIILDMIDDVKTLIGWLQGAGDLISKAGSLFSAGNPNRGGRGSQFGPIHAATGYEGVVGQPTLFLAGEGVGTEHVSIGPTGGSRSGVTSLHVHIDRGAFIDGPGLDRLTNEIMRRVKFATGV